jgi:hypothetical protein
VVDDQLPGQRRWRERPACASVALPANSITSFTLQVLLAAGAVMVAVGAVFPTVIVTDAVPEAPWLSVTRRLARIDSLARVGVAVRRRANPRCLRWRRAGL